MANACPDCGQPAQPEHRFCGFCGTALEPAPTGSGDAVDPSAENRQITVMFCDLVGSTRLSGRLHPEPFRDLIRSYQTAAAEKIERYAGYIAQYLGDGILVYFGYPLAHEDDPRRAVLAGLAIVRAMDPLSRQWQSLLDEPLAVRVGIHTGPVVTGVFGGGKRREHLAVGQTPNIAARIQGLTAPNTVIASADSHKLVGDFFVSEALGSHELRGVPEPVELFRMVEESSYQSPFEHTSPFGLTELVGRHEEKSVIFDRFERAGHGHGQLVLVQGEAGIGKSRLVYALKEETALADRRWLVWRCSAYYRDSALYPVSDFLTRFCELEREDSPEAGLAKLAARLREIDLDGPEHDPTVFDLKDPNLTGFDAKVATSRLAALLSLPHDEDQALPPRKQRAETFEVLIGLLLRLAEKQTTVLVVEDLHWADPSTLELLTRLAERAPRARLLILTTARPSFRSEWGELPRFTSVTLQRLEEWQMEAVLSRVTSGRRLPAEVLHHILEKSDGIPMVAEELTKMVLESDLLRPVGNHYELTAPLTDMAIPATLQSSLTGRLDRLGPAKDLAQLASVVGREAGYPLIRAVSGQVEDRLQRQLQQLVDAEVVYQRGHPPDATYLFKHALIQAAAYGSLLKKTRRAYHRAIADELIAEDPEVVHKSPELLAHHYTEAGRVRQALQYWHSATRKAQRKYANKEAIHHARRALELLVELPETHPRHLQELEFQMLLGRALIASRGFAEPEVEVAFSRARRLCSELDDPERMFGVLSGLFPYFLVRCELDKALGLARRMGELASASGDAPMIAEYELNSALALHFLGRLDEALDAYDRAYKVAADRDPSSPASSSGIDPLVVARAMSGVAAWHRGHADQAVERTREAVALAREQGSPVNLGDALHSASWVHQLRGDREAVAEIGREMVALSEEQSFHFVAQGNIQLGWALADAPGAEPEETSRGIERLEWGLNVYRATGARLADVYFVSILSQVYLRRGRADDAEQLVAGSEPPLDTMPSSFLWRPELLRLKALIAAERNPELAEELLLSALAQTRLQTSLAFELRVSVDLARLWQRDGKSSRALKLLRRAHDRFGEGFETADLVAARELIRELEE